MDRSKSLIGIDNTRVALSKVILRIIGTLLLCALMPQLSAEAFDDRLLRRVTLDHPQVRAATAEYNAARAELRAAKLSRWPSLSITTNSQESATNAALLIEQPLWTGGRLSGQIQAATYAVDAARVGIAQVRRTLGTQFILRWQKLLVAQNSLAAHKQALTRLDHYEKMMQRRIAAQVSAAIELELLQSRSAQMRNLANSAQGETRIALAQLGELLGDDLSDDEMALLLRPIAHEHIQQWLDQHPLEAQLTHADTAPDVRLSQLTQHIGAEKLKVEQADRWPQVFAKFQSQLSQDPLSNQPKDKVWIEMSYTANGGFSSFARADAQSARLRALDANIESVRRDTRAQIKTDYHSLQQALQFSQTMEQAIDNATAVRKSYERQFTAGRKSWLDVLNSLREVAQNRVQLAEARANASAAYLRLVLQSGQLDGLQTTPITEVAEYVR